jgi:hypothetical protein
MTLHEVVFYSAHGKMRLEQPNQATAHPPSQTKAHKENPSLKMTRKRQMALCVDQLKESAG